ncbi:MAG: hypothetical protein ACRC1H_11765 [Caldilineaceae bacterium]
MATIPMGNFGQAVARPGQMPAAPRGDAGLSDAAQRTGQMALSAVGQEQQQEARARAEQQAQEDRAAQQQAAEWDREASKVEAAALRAKTITALTGTKDALTDLHDEIGQAVLDGKIPRETAEAEYTKRAGKITESAGADLPQDHRAIVGAELNADSARFGNSIRKIVTQRGRQEITASIKTSLESLQRQYRANPQASTAQAMSLIDTLGPQSSLNPEQLASMKQGWKEGTQYTEAFEQVRGARNDPAALSALDKALARPDYLPDVDPQRRAQLQDTVSSYRFALEQKAELAAQRAARKREAHLNQAQAEFSVFQGLADKGTAFRPDYIDRAMKATAGTPFQAGIKALAEQARNTGGLAAMPIRQQQQALDQLDALIAQQGRTPELDTRRAQVEKVLRGSRADLELDGMRAGVERGVIDGFVPLNFGAGLPGLVQQLQTRASQAQRVGAWAGRAVSPLTPEEAEQLSTMLAASDPQGFGQSVGLLASSLPAGQMAAIAKQIDAKDKPLALAMAAGSTLTTAGRNVAELIWRGSRAVKDKAQETRGAEATKLREDIIKAVGDALPGRLRDDVIESATLIAYGVRTGGGNSTPLGAVHLALGGPIVAHNGRRIPVPAGLDANVLRDRLEAYPRAEVERHAIDGWVQFGGSRPMGVPEFLQALPDAELEPAGRGKYTVRVGGSMALTKDRKPLVIEVQR